MSDRWQFQDDIHEACGHHNNEGVHVHGFRIDTAEACVCKNSKQIVYDYIRVRCRDWTYGKI